MNMKLYKTTDLNIAAILHSHKIPFKGLEMSPTNFLQYMFVFDETKEAKLLLADYNNSRLKIEVNSFVSSQRLLKAMVYEKRNNQI